MSGVANSNWPGVSCENSNVWTDFHFEMIKHHIPLGVVLKLRVKL